MTTKKISVIRQKSLRDEHLKLYESKDFTNDFQTITSQLLLRLNSIISRSTNI